MTLEEAKEKASKLQHLVGQNPYRPKNKKLIEVVVAPSDENGLQGFVEGRFKHDMPDDYLLENSSYSDFNIYGVFEDEPPYSLIKIQNLITVNQDFPEIASLSISDYQL